MIYFKSTLFIFKIVNMTNTMKSCQNLLNWIQINRKNKSKLKIINYNRPSEKLKLKNHKEAY